MHLASTQEAVSFLIGLGSVGFAVGILIAATPWLVRRLDPTGLVSCALTGCFVNVGVWIAGAGFVVLLIGVALAVTSGIPLVPPSHSP